MNQAAYAEVMELARWHWMVRSGMFRTMVRDRLNVVVGRQEIVYRRELKPLTAFVIDVRAIDIERRAVRVEHHFIVGDRVHAKGTADLVVLGRDGVAPADTVRSTFGPLVQPRLQVTDWRVA
jgi:acyl-CoA thioesterase FadM